MTDPCETKTHLKGYTREAPTPAPPSSTRSFCPTPAASPGLAFGGNRCARVPPTDTARSCGAGRPHPRTRSEGRGASFLPRSRLHSGGFHDPARTPPLLTLHQPLSPTPPTAGRPLGHRRAACTPRAGLAAIPATLGLLTTGAAHTHRGLRPTQAWLFPGAVPAQRHLLRTLTEPPGPPCERERETAARRPLSRAASPSQPAAAATTKATLPRRRPSSVC